jgi:hypothetical protein
VTSAGRDLTRGERLIVLVLAVGAVVSLVPILVFGVEVLRAPTSWLSYTALDRSEPVFDESVVPPAVLALSYLLAPVCLLGYLVVVLRTRRAGAERWVAAAALVLVADRMLRMAEGSVWFPTQPHEAGTAGTWILALTSAALLLSCWLVAVSVQRVRRTPARARPGPGTVTR